MVSPLTLGKLKRWQPAKVSSRGSPDRCAERGYVQVRWRAAHEEVSSRQLRKRHFFFLCCFFPSHRNSVRVTPRDSTAGPSGSPLCVLKHVATVTSPAALLFVLLLHASFILHLVSLLLPSPLPVPLCVVSDSIVRIYPKLFALIVTSACDPH